MRRLLRELLRDDIADVVNERLDALLAGDDDVDFRVEAIRVNLTGAT